MFRRYQEGAFVKEGTYLSLRAGEFVSIGEEGGRLPDMGVSYVAVSPVIALLVGPLAGLAFVIFLPLAVPLFCGWLIARRLYAAMPNALRQGAASLIAQPRRAVYVGNGVAQRREAVEKEMAGDRHNEAREGDSGEAEQ